MISRWSAVGNALGELKSNQPATTQLIWCIRLEFHPFGKSDLIEASITSIRKFDDPYRLIKRYYVNSY